VPCRARRRCEWFNALAWLHVLGLQTLGACRHLKLYLLAFDQLAIPLHIDGRVMHKDILAAIVGRNEAVALGIVEPLHRSGRHFPAPHKKIDGEAVVRRATAVKNPLLAVSLSGSCGAATSGYYVLRREIYHAVHERSNRLRLTIAPTPGMIARM
jgi:hypothetical protein